MKDLKSLFRENYLQYASYVILERAIPELIDGLKPVQRRILWTLFQMDDGKLHKVANVSGQTMALHPHGTDPITEALVNLANKGFLLDTQGNFGNPLTGDPSAAARYIETRLSSLAKETLFSQPLTLFSPSYDGRKQEPIFLPAKIPLLLMQGTEGIAVGMATRILPHNFKELLEGEIALLEGKEITILPDFPSGGIMDPSEYAGGLGKVKVRAKIDVVDDKTLIIREICYSTTTESLIRSIDDAAKRGKIKIESINDYTAEKIEIEVKLPRGHYANEAIDALYAFTECEVSLHSQMIMIREDLPWEGGVEEVLLHHALLLQGYLRQELEVEKKEIAEKIFQKTLEEIFIENRLYKPLEESKTYEKMHETLEKGLTPFYHRLNREPGKEDRDYLLGIPIRRISYYDRHKNQSDIEALQKLMVAIDKNLKNIKRYAINYLKDLIEKYGALFPRRTKIGKIGALDVKELAKKKVKVGYDEESGYLGLKVASKRYVECLNVDKLLLLFADGSYQVMHIPDKKYIHTQGAALLWMGVADKTTELAVVYHDKKSKLPYGKRFIVKQFILEKLYRFIPEEMVIDYMTSDMESLVELVYKGKKSVQAMKELALKGVGARGDRLANLPLKEARGKI